jgi:DNA-binding NarL/FixJ family response regulator
MGRHEWFIQLRGGDVIVSRILFVEHDANLREAFASAVREALDPDHPDDVAFVGAGSVAEARARLREGGLDAALVDAAMPDGDGLELVHEINDGGVGSPMPTLVWTARLDPSVAVRAMEAGADGAFSKEASAQEVAGAIKRVLGGGRSGA